MKILVVWWAWYIWSHTVFYLIDNWISPKDIIIFDNLVYGHKEFLPDEVEFVQWDLLNKKDILNVFETKKIDVVIHFAAYAYVWESMQNPWKYFENNVSAWVNLLEAMVAGWCNKIVFSSSCAVYGNPDTLPILESELCKPINVYWETKLMFEKILEWYNRIYWIKSVRLRYFNAWWAWYGIWESHDPETHLIPLVLNVASWKSPFIKVFWNDYDTIDWTCIRDYIHVIDLADAHFRAFKLMDKDDFSTDFFNLWTWVWTSVQEIIDISKIVIWKDIEVKIEKRRDWDPAVLVADPAKAQENLWWVAQYSIRDIISDARDWEKQK